MVGTGEPQPFSVLYSSCLGNKISNIGTPQMILALEGAPYWSKKIMKYWKGASIGAVPSMHIRAEHDSYSGFSIIWTAVWQDNLNTARISELVRISEQPVKSYCVA